MVRVEETDGLVGNGGVLGQTTFGQSYWDIGTLAEDSTEVTFFASWLLSIFTRLFSSESHCVCRASRKQEKALPP